MEYAKNSEFPKNTPVIQTSMPEDVYKADYRDQDSNIRSKSGSLEPKSSHGTPKIS